MSEDYYRCRNLIHLKKFLENENKTILMGIKIFNKSSSDKTSERICKKIVDGNKNIICEIQLELRRLKVNLRFRMHEAIAAGFKSHPEKVMKDFDISYKEGIPQSLGDQWWFIDCENLPEKLPDFLEFMEYEGT